MKQDLAHRKTGPRRANPALARLAEFGPEAQRAMQALEARAERIVLPGRERRIVWRRWGRGEPVVLLHGSAGSWVHWIRTIDALADAHSLLIPDLPGCGDSDAAAAPGDYASITRALAQDLDELTAADAPLGIVGFSLGSHFAIRLAQHCAPRTRHLVLIGSNLADRQGRTGQSRLANWTQAATEAEAIAALRANLNAMMLADPASIDPLALELYMTDVVRSRLRLTDLGPFRPLVDGIVELAPHIRLTGISGRDDQIFHEVIPHQQASLDRIRPGSAFHLIAPAGHWVMYEAAERFNQVLRDTLSAPCAD